MPTYIALLRAVNVGGRKMAMSTLRETCEALGLQNVRTYIQSGNLLFETAEPNPIQLQTMLEAMIVATFGYESAVILRTAAQLEAIIASNPFAEHEPTPAKLHIAFLSAPPPAGRVADLASFCAAGEQIEIMGTEAYLWYPNNMGTSKLTTNVLEKKLGVTATTRNWNTVRKLSEL